MLFKDRQQAGELLGQKLKALIKGNPIVLALPRGGVPVGFEISRALNAPLDILAVRKIGAPHNPELAVGAISEDGTPLLSLGIMTQLDLTKEDLISAIEKELSEIKRQVRIFRKGREALDFKDKSVLIVDDGLATGATAKAAARIAKRRGAKSVTIVAPVAAANSAGHIRKKNIDVIALEEPEDLLAVGHWYFNFDPISDEEVIRLLELARSKQTVDY